MDEQDQVILRRGQVEAFFSKVLQTEVALEACARAYQWGRVLGAMGHWVKLIPPQYMKPFVKHNKNDRNDAAMQLTILKMDHRSGACQVGRLTWNNRAVSVGPPPPRI